MYTTEVVMSENTSKMSMARLSLRRISSRLTFLDATIESSHSFFKRACSFFDADLDFLPFLAFWAVFSSVAGIASDCSAVCSCADVCSAIVLSFCCSLIFLYVGFYQDNGAGFLFIRLRLPHVFCLYSTKVFSSCTLN